MTTRRRLPLPKFEIRFGWLVLLALIAQLIVIYVGFGEAGVIRRFIFPSSYVLLLAFILFNRRRVGLLVIGVGMLLNFLAIVSNGGLMPVSPASVEEAGLADELADLELGDPVPVSKNVLLAEGDTNLRWLSDRFTWDAARPIRVFSVGDIVIAAGALVTLIELFLPPVMGWFRRDRPSPV